MQAPSRKISITGDCSLSTDRVNTIYSGYEQLFSVVDKQESDIDDVCWDRLTKSDSSTLIFLLEMNRQAQARGRVLRHHSLPQSLKLLAKLYGIEDLLGAV